MNVAVLGASPKPDRYAHKAIRKLMEKGHNVIPINPAHKEIEGLPVAPSLTEIEAGSVDTVTVYLKPETSSQMVAQLTFLKPRRVIFNPGAENAYLKEHLEDAGIEVVENCTLVLLSTEQF